MTRTRAAAGWPLLAAAALAVQAAPAAAQVVLSDNLSAATAGTAAVAGTTWVASSFGTTASPATLTAVRLKVGNSAPGAATLSIFTDSLDTPTTLVGTLTSPAAYPASPDVVTFGGNAINLAANATYWVVLRADGGQFDWAYTFDNAGTGAGFQGTFADTADAGQNWTFSDLFPAQMQVIVTPVPEPAALLVVAAAGLLTRRLFRHP